MAEETGIQETANEETTVENQGKTFTQDELNAVLQERLARANVKHEKAVEELETKIAELTSRIGKTDEKEAENDRLTAALERIKELEAEQAEREKAAERKSKIEALINKHSIEPELASILDYVPDDKLEEKAELLAKRFSEPSKNERTVANVKAPNDALKEWASGFLNSNN